MGLPTCSCTNVTRAVHKPPRWGSVEDVHEPVVDALVTGDVPIAPMDAHRLAEHLAQWTSAAGELAKALGGAKLGRAQGCDPRACRRGPARRVCNIADDVQIRPWPRNRRAADRTLPS